MADTVTRRTKHPCSPNVYCWILCLVVIHGGCGTGPLTTENASEVEDNAPLGVEPDRPPAAPIPGAQLAEENAFSDQNIDGIRAAIERCGGTLRCDEQGGLIEVDLLTGRASADASALDALKSRPEVRILRARVGQLSADQLATLSSLADLEELLLQDAVIDDNMLIDLVDSLPHLRRLTLRNGPEVTDRAIIELARRSALTHLALIDMQISGQSVRQFGSMASLVFLDLRMCHGIQGDELAALSGVPKLKELKLAGSGIDNAALAVVATLPHLQRLTIEDAAIDGVGISSLAESETAADRLETLTFSRCTALTDDQLQSLEAFRNLRQLTLRDVPITGLFLKSLSSTDQLELLSLNQTFLAEDAFERIAAFRNLTRLELAQNILSPQAMKYIATLRKLEYLNLTDCAISDVLLKPLAGHPKLHTVIVTGNADVSRAAVADLLRQHTKPNE